MNAAEILLLATGLSADACAVSLGLGLAAGKAPAGDCLKAGAYFGAFQALMPVAGYCAASFAAGFLGGYGYFAAFALLAFLGA